ncbi:MAG: GntR family transcriptional regulator [Eggerthellaceae bacterium]|nr:GntR family transcriptional regulator [Eggerthellaceae bacterium]
MQEQGVTKTITFAPDEGSTIPLWVQLRKRIIFLISSGYFIAGDQLPKIRELAADISINFNTVNKAYLSLQSDGYLVSVRGKGVFVSDAVRTDAQDGASQVDALLDDCLRACKKLGLNYDEAVSQMTLRAMRMKMAEAKPQQVPGLNVINLFPDDPSEKEVRHA